MGTDPTDKGDKNEHGEVTSPERVSIHLYIYTYIYIYIYYKSVSVSDSV